MLEKIAIPGQTPGIVLSFRSDSVISIDKNQAGLHCGFFSTVMIEGDLKLGCKMGK